MDIVVTLEEYHASNTACQKYKYMFALARIIDSFSLDFFCIFVMWFKQFSNQ